MKLSKIKTDKSDARAICEYAVLNEVPLYIAKNKNQAIIETDRNLFKTKHYSQK